MNTRRALAILLLPLFTLLLISSTAPAFATPKAEIQNPRSKIAHPAPSVIHDFQVSLTDKGADINARFMVSPPLVRRVFRYRDTDGDGLVSEAERDAWVQAYLATRTVQVEGQARPIQLVRVSPVRKEQWALSMRQAVSLPRRLDFPLPPADDHR